MEITNISTYIDIEDRLDINKELEISIYDRSAWINKDQAIVIINHLKEVFDINN